MKRSERAGHGGEEDPDITQQAVVAPPPADPLHPHPPPGQGLIVGVGEGGGRQKEGGVMSHLAPPAVLNHPVTVPQAGLAQGHLIHDPDEITDTGVHIGHPVMADTIGATGAA